jgi:hypothetical protein
MLIFTFWEPKGSVVPYLELCMETWAERLPDCRIVVLDHSNLHDWIDPATITAPALRRLQYPMQKDVVLSAVLSEHGGIFMDADTIVVGDLSPMLDALRHSEVVTFAQHMAVVGAQPGSLFMAAWFQRNRQRLQALEDWNGSPPDLRWDYVANSTFQAALDDQSDGAWLAGLLRTSSVDRTRRASPILARAHSLLRSSWHQDRRGRSRRGIHTSLNRDRYSFMPEHLHFPTRQMGPAEKYQRFWFQTDLDLDEVLLEGQAVIGLHHSWTPDWYTALTREELRSDGTLLSRTLRHLTD